MSADDLEQELLAAAQAWSKAPFAHLFIRAADALAAKDTALSEMRAELERLSGIICDLFQEDKHYDGCLFKGNRNLPCQCGYNDRMLLYKKAIRAAEEHAAARNAARAASQDDGEER